MKILVTGGAGFIGQHLIKSLLENNNIITIFDNFSNTTKKSVEYLIKKGVKIIEGDIINCKEILDASKNQDIVIHLAAKISVIKSIKNPLETFEVNVNGTTNVLIACEKNNVEKLIVSSSAAVYGQGVKDIKIGENKELKPISPYGESKMRMEEQIDEYVRNKKIKCIILRFFNIYGINQSDEYAGVITKFLKRIKQGKNLEVFGNGMQTRDFVSIKDVINSINNAILYKKSGTYNIATGEAITINELAKKIIFLSKKNVKILYLNIKNSEIKFSQASIESAKKDLKYNPKINLDIGIRELLDR